MKRKISYNFLIIIQTILVACSTKEKAIEGTLSNLNTQLNGKKIYLCNYSVGGKKIDSTIILNNHFKFTLPDSIIDNPFLAVIKYEDSFKNQPYLRILIGYENPYVKKMIMSYFIVDGSISFTCVPDNKNLYKINYEQKENIDLFLKQTKFGYLYIKNSINRKEQLKKDIDLVNKNKTSYYLLSLLFDGRSASTEFETRELLNAFSRKLQHSKLAESILEFYSHKGNLTGSYNYLLTGLTKTKDSLFNAAKKNQLLIFWASWCKPCRKEIPELKSVYLHQIDTNTTSFTSISIDSEKANWLAALKQEQMPWKQLFTETTVELNEIENIFNINQIPVLYLKKNDSLILLKSLNDDAMKSILRNK